MMALTIVMSRLVLDDDGNDVDEHLLGEHHPLSPDTLLLPEHRQI